MKVILKLELEDIRTGACGLNYRIITKDGTEIIFSPSAVDEFINDMKKVREDQAIKEAEANAARALKPSSIDHEE